MEKNSDFLVMIVILGFFLGIYTFKYLEHVENYGFSSDVSRFSLSYRNKFNYTQSYRFLGVDFSTIDYFKFFPFNPMHLSWIVSFFLIPFSMQLFLFLVPFVGYGFVLGLSGRSLYVRWVLRGFLVCSFVLQVLFDTFYIVF